MKEKTRRSGIYLLPNILTTASLFAAFYSIVSSMQGQFELAAVAIFIGMIADSLDGRIARMTNTQSEFGAQYDSLSDLVTFGVAPALLAYSYSLQFLGKMGWLIAFVYTAAVALRLARFNVYVDIVDKRYFQGFPCPAAAGVLSALVWILSQQEWHNMYCAVIVAIITVYMAVLMVSNIRFASFKELDFKGKVPFLYIIGMVLLFTAIAINPALVLFFGFLIYSFTGLIQTLLALHKLRKQRKRIRIIK